LILETIDSKKYSGLSEREVYKKQMEKGMKNPIWGTFLKKIRTSHKSNIK
jgi:hypothetical protein